MLRHLFSLLMFIACSACAAPTPCDASIDQTLSRAQKTAWSPPVSRHLGVPDVTILTSYRLHGWNIIYADTRQSDEVFLFYSDDPTTTSFVAMWSGAARADEEDEVRRWTMKNVPNIPPPLAACFAWEVTKHRTM